MSSIIECGICLDHDNKELNSNDFINKIKTPCGHYFHSSCFFKWIEHKQNCPICRSKFFYNDREKYYQEVRRLEQDIQIKENYLLELKEEIKKSKIDINNLNELYKEIFIKYENFSAKVKNLDGEINNLNKIYQHRKQILKLINNTISLYKNKLIRLRV